MVEDHEALAGLYYLLLEALGYEVFVAEDLASARARLALPPSPALAIVDVLLPDGSGLELCGELRRRWPALPILVVTARAGDRERDAALAAGATLVLDKFADSEELEAAVRALLGPRALTSPPDSDK